MQCPTCGSYEQKTVNLKVDQFDEGLIECFSCGSSWSLNHGHAELIVDTQPHSFLECQSECVESDDYNWSPR
ncbi:MAG: hypothetical protein QNK27_12750 [Desulfuromusa sp.]|nr:hypothetical protein [Desulfuromusa sp.]